MRWRWPVMLGVVLTWLVVVLAGPAAAETGAALLRRGVEQYQLAGFQEASRSLLACLASTDLTATQRARAHAYLGLIQLARGETDRARQSFGRAKAADRNYSPDPNQFSPQALRLFHQAPLPPSAIQGPRPGGGPARRISPPPPRGFVVGVAKKAIVIDLGGGQGVRGGDRFQVIGPRKGSQGPVALVQVTRVRPEISFARVMQGQAGSALGMRVVKVSSAKLKPAASPKTKAAPRTSRVLRLAVLPPDIQMDGYSPDFDPSQYQARVVVRALAKTKGVRAFVPPPQRLARAQQRGFKRGAFLLPGTVTFSGLTRALKGYQGVHCQKAVFTPAQVRLLRQAMKTLRADALLVWGVRLVSGGDQVVVSCNLHLKGRVRSAACSGNPMFLSDAPAGYAEVLRRLTAAGLAAGR